MTEFLHTRNDQLDGLRGYAAIAVVIFHSILSDPKLTNLVLDRNFSKLIGWHDYLTKITLIVFNGQTAVVLFFILSGAVLFESLQRETGSVPAIVGKFLFRRLLRIYPALVICLLIGWLVCYFFTTPRSFDQLVSNLLLYDFPVNGPTWTLNVEALGALFLIAAFVVFLFFGEFGVILIGCVFGLLYLQPFKAHLASFKMFIYCFTMGALISTRLGKRVISFVPTASWPILLAAMLFAEDTF